MLSTRLRALAVYVHVSGCRLLVVATLLRHLLALLLDLRGCMRSTLRRRCSLCGMKRLLEAHILAMTEAIWASSTLIFPPASPICFADADNEAGSGVPWFSRARSVFQSSEQILVSSSLSGCRLEGAHRENQPNGTQPWRPSICLLNEVA